MSGAARSATFVALLLAVGCKGGGEREGERARASEAEDDREREGERERARERERASDGEDADDGAAEARAKAIDVAAAARWLAAFPADELRFDAAIALTQITRRLDEPALAPALEAARAVADADADHPGHRLLDPSFRAPKEATAGWALPADGERANVNRVVHEALHCDRNGLRAGTLDYIVGPMRDGGGYHTAHGLWALALARDNGCLDGESFAARAQPLIAELRAAQQAQEPFATTLDVDLFAERALVLALAGDRGDLDAWLARLASAQLPDGSFGVRATDEPAYYRYHATALVLWALSAR